MLAEVCATLPWATRGVAQVFSCPGGAGCPHSGGRRTTPGFRIQDREHHAASIIVWLPPTARWRFRPSRRTSPTPVDLAAVFKTDTLIALTWVNVAAGLVVAAYLPPESVLLAG